MIPYVGIGGAHAFGAENRSDGEKSFSSFLFGGGLLNTFSLSDKLSAYLNLGLDVVDAIFDGWKGHEKGDKKFNGIVAASIGCGFDFLLLISFPYIIINVGREGFKNDKTKARRDFFPSRLLFFAH